MKNTKEDRRSRRTRQMLHQALFALMREKPHPAITVQDIIDRANVGRSTFYAHFTDKEDLTVSGLEAVLEALSQAPDHTPAREDEIISTVGMFRHALEEPELFRTFMHGRGMELFVEKTQAYWSRKAEERLRTQLPKGQEPALPLPVVSNFLAGSFVVLLKWWVDNKMPYSPERMDEMLRQLVMPGVWLALGETA